MSRVKVILRHIPTICLIVTLSMLPIISIAAACNYKITRVADYENKACWTMGFRNCSYYKYSSACEYCEIDFSGHYSCYQDESYQVTKQYYAYGNCIGDYSGPGPYECINGEPYNEPMSWTCYYTSTTYCE